MVESVEEKRDRVRRSYIADQTQYTNQEVLASRICVVVVALECHACVMWLCMDCCWTLLLFMGFCGHKHYHTPQQAHIWPEMPPSIIQNCNFFFNGVTLWEEMRVKRPIFVWKKKKQYQFIIFTALLYKHKEQLLPKCSAYFSFSNGNKKE